MATQKQAQAARHNVKKAQQAAKAKRTIANLPKSTRRGLGRQAARGRRLAGQAGHALEDRSREQPYEIAKGEGHQGSLEDGEVGSHSGDPALRLGPAEG